MGWTCVDRVYRWQVYLGQYWDRNGLRPSRYYLTHDDKVIMASEVGVLPVDPSNVKAKGRLQPGKMFLVDFNEGRLIPDEELKSEFAKRRPYGEWIAEQKIELSDIPQITTYLYDANTLLARMQAFGYTVETMQFMLLPMVTEARDPLGSMGNDSALACLSDKSRMIYDYFKQLFAQVTNPPIDSIREEVVMSLDCFIGPEGNLLTTTEKHANRLRLPHPILSNDELRGIQEMDYRGWRSAVIDITFTKSGGEAAMQQTLNRICQESSEAIDNGYSLIILSDRNIGPDRMAISSLVACSTVHHHLVAAEQRTQIGIIVETGEAREVHHHCLLCGYGADAINPYVAFEALWQAREDGLLDHKEYPDPSAIVYAYKKASCQGHAQSDGQNGHFHPALLQGCPDFRSRGSGR